MYCISACWICKPDITHTKVLITQHTCFSSSPEAVDFIPLSYRTGQKSVICRCPKSMLRFQALLQTVPWDNSEPEHCSPQRSLNPWRKMQFSFNALLSTCVLLNFQELGSPFWLSCVVLKLLSLFLWHQNGLNQCLILWSCFSPYICPYTIS